MAVLAGRCSGHSTWLLVTEGLQTLVTWLPSFFCKQSRKHLEALHLLHRVFAETALATSKRVMNARSYSKASILFTQYSVHTADCPTLLCCCM